MKGVKITQDHLKRVMETLRAMETKDLLVGIPAGENSRDDGPIGNAQIGYINENGSPAQNIPARPFLAPGVLKAKGAVADLLAAGAAAALDGGSSLQTAFDKAGLVAQNSVKMTLRAGDGYAPLSASTLAARARRGVSRTKPLIDTGQLLNSITYVVRDR